MCFIVSDSYGGGSADWAKAVARIKYSYLIELRDGGTHGFLLPPDQILPTGQETWAGLHTIATEIINKYIKPQTKAKYYKNSTSVKPAIVHHKNSDLQVDIFTKEQQRHEELDNMESSFNAASSHITFSSVLFVLLKTVLLSVLGQQCSIYYLLG